MKTMTQANRAIFKTLLLDYLINYIFSSLKLIHKNHKNFNPPQVAILTFFPVFEFKCKVQRPYRKIDRL